jgi:hypothetical protein
MTIDVSSAQPSPRRVVFVQLREAIKSLDDRFVLTALFVILFIFNYAPNLMDALANISAVENDLTHSRTITGAEILGFVAIAVVLKDLKADRVLKWSDFVAVIGIAIASVYPSSVSRAIAMTYLGLLFVPRTDKRLASLGQLCLGLVWIDFWGPLVLTSIKDWLLPIETAFAYLPLSFFGSFSSHGMIIANDNGWAIRIIEACSAFHNTITAAFMWLSLIKIQRLDFRPRYFGILAIGVAVVVLLNTARIGIMAVSQSQYLFWHMGPGLWVVKIVMLSAVLGLFYFGLSPAQKRGSSFS